MKLLRSKLTYANVISTLCLILVLGGGTAYAATVGLAPNSVGASQIKAGSVGTSEMKSDSVGVAQLKEESVGQQQLQPQSISSDKLKNGSVTLSKLSEATKKQLEGQKGETGATGAPGATGVQGVQGPPGTTATSSAVETEVINKATTTNTTALKEETVHCPDGPVLGGGYVLHSETSAAASAKLRAIRSYPVDPSTWLVRAVDDSNGTEGAWELTVSVVCEK